MNVGSMAGRAGRPGLLLRAFLLVHLAFLAACAAAEARDTRVRTALAVLGEVIDPAYALAVDGCHARERDAVVRAELGTISKTEGTADYQRIKAACAELTRAFDAIRLYHHQAAELVERGDLKAAEAELNHARAIWRQLQEDHHESTQ